MAKLTCCWAAQLSWSCLRMHMMSGRRQPIQLELGSVDKLTVAVCAPVDTEDLLT